MVNGLHDPELEWAVVAEALRRYDRFQTYGLAVEHFESARYRAVLAALAEAFESGEGTGLSPVARFLQRSGTLEKPVGGQRGLAEIAAGPGTGVVADAKRLRDQWRLRRLRDQALEAARLASSGDFTAALAAVQDAQQAALGSVGGKTMSAGELGRAAVQGIADKARGRRMHPGLPLVRKYVGDLGVGSMLVVGGDSNVSKSSFVLEMLIAASKHQPVGLVSVEDPDDITGARLLSAFCRVSARNITRGNLDKDDLEAIKGGCSELDSLGSRLLYEDCMGGTDVDVCAAMSRMAARGAKIIAVDYIQEIDCSKKQQDRRNEIRWLGKRLKQHARNLGVALIVVSQLARPSDKQTGKRPTKHMLKESGDLTNQAEVILLLWRMEEKDDAPVIVTAVKIKHGGVGEEWRMQRMAELGGRLVELEERYGQ